MATLKQINASRTNGARSQGPVTAEGKARVAQNGTKHGIYSQIVVLQNEDHSVYNETRDHHLQEWTPATPSEYNLVIDIIDARWRLRRFSTLETAAIDFEVERMRPEVNEVFESIDEPTRTVLAFNTLITNNRTFEVLQTAIRHQHRIIDRATNQLRRLRKDRLDSPGPNTTNPGGGGPVQAAATTPPEPANAAPISIENQGTKPEPVPEPARATLQIVSRSPQPRFTATPEARAAAA